MMKNLFRKFLADRSGNILILTGLGFLFLVGIGGAAHDLGKQQLVKQRIQQAADAAALAAAGMPPGTSETARRNTANAFFSLNYPANYLGIPRPTPSVAISTNVTVSGSANVPTAFVGNLGVESLVAQGTSVVQIVSYANKVDLILVMDNSGSMAMRDVGTGNSLNGSPTTHANCLRGWIAYYGLYGAPLSQAGAAGFCATYEGSTGFTRLNALRYAATKLTDDMINPNPDDHQIALVTWDNWLMGSQNFSKNPTTVKNFLNEMYGRAATDSSKGLDRAETLTAGFRSDAAHVVVLMTDGQNGSDRSLPPEVAAINAASLAACNRLKARPGTLVFTIAFGREVINDPTVKQFLSDCATGPNGTANPKPNENTFFFAAPDAEALAKAFDSIVGTAKNLRIVQ